MRRSSFVRTVALAAGVASVSCSSATAPSSPAGRHPAALDASLGAVISIASAPVASGNFDVIVRTVSGGGCERPAGIEVEYVSGNEAIVVPFVVNTSQACSAILAPLDYRVTLRFLSPGPATIRVGGYQLNVLVGA